MQFKKEELIKSPLNYTGGKYKLLPQILPYFPDDINTFVDLFAGGCNVGVNVKADTIVCNDIDKHVIELLNYFKGHTYDSIINEIENIIHKYGLSETNVNGYEYYGCNSSQGLANYNKEKYIKLRNDYNNSKERPSIMFYVILIFAFNNYIKFNKQNNFTTAVNKRDFNNSLRKKLKEYIDRLNDININFVNKDFRELNIDILNSNDFVYVDPPYANTKGMYFGTIDLNKYWNWLRKLKCNYSFTFDGSRTDKDNTYNVPNNVYSNHIYLQKQISGFKKLHKDTEYVKESLYIK